MGRFNELVRQAFAADCEAWAVRGWSSPNPGPLTKCAMLIRYAGLRATLLHRVAHWACIVHVPGVPMTLQALNLWFHGIELTPRVPIGPGLYLVHTTGSVITAVEIGASVEIQGGITVGQRNQVDFPVIEDDVVLGAGCRVLGGITLGRGARVGANAVVLQDVPAGCTAVGVPARVLRSSDAAQP